MSDQQQSAWALELELFLKKHQPKFYRELKESGQLKAHCQRAAVSSEVMRQ
jgi:hypothetical protein